MPGNDDGKILRDWNARIQLAAAQPIGRRVW
jgi:hypothetical protein